MLQLCYNVADVALMLQECIQYITVHICDHMLYMYITCVMTILVSSQLRIKFGQGR